MADYRKVARQKARKYGLDPNIFVRQINAESGFNPNARSPVGATGIAQIMPGTARGWGVNPNDPVASLDAAARNMARYVKQYGSYEKALRAYNAGPGAIEKSRGYAETNNYVAKILRGKDPKRLGRSQGGGGSRNGRGRGGTAPQLAPNLQQTGMVAAPGMAGMARAALPERAPISAPPLPEFAAHIPTVQTSGAPSRPERPNLSEMISGLQPSDVTRPRLPVPTVIPGKPRQNRGGGGKPLRGKGKVAEMFYDKGISLDNGRRVGPIGGHGSHVHVAGDPRLMVKLGRRAQKQGLSVRENPVFDKVDPVHTGGSFHYKTDRKGRGFAIDVSGDPAKLRRFNRRVARIAGR